MMVQEADHPLPVAEPDPSVTLTDAQLTALIDEIARVQTLYLDARSSTQSVFNFFLTLVTAVIGATIFMVQNEQSPLMLSGLLLFSSLAGSVYLGALSGRYGQAARYARLLDVLRRELFQHTAVPLPTAYDHLLNAEPPAATYDPVILWIFPTGTYQMFMAVLVATGLSIMTAQLLFLAGITLVPIFWICVIIFFVTLTILNVYSHLVIERYVRHLDARIDFGKGMAMWASRQ